MAAGMPDFVVTYLGSLRGAEGEARAIVDNLSKALREIAAEPAIQSRIQVAGAKSLGSTPRR